MNNGEQQEITKADLLERGERRKVSRCGVTEFWEGHFMSSEAQARQTGTRYECGTVYSRIPSA